MAKLMGPEEFAAEFSSRQPLTAAKFKPVTKALTNRLVQESKNVRARENFKPGTSGTIYAKEKSKAASDSKKRASERAKAAAIAAAMPKGTPVDQKKASNKKSGDLGKALSGAGIGEKKGGGGLFGSIVDAASSAAGIGLGGAGKFIDVAQRPLNAVTNIGAHVIKSEIASGKNADQSILGFLSPAAWGEAGFRIAADPTEYAKAGYEGLSGKYKEGTHGITKQGNLIRNDVKIPLPFLPDPSVSYSTSLDLVGDVALDPLTYLSGGTSVASKKGAFGASKTLAGLENVADKSGLIKGAVGQPSRAMAARVFEGGVPAAVDLEQMSLRAGAKAAAKPAAIKSAKKAAQNVLIAETKKLAAKGAPIQTISDPVTDAFRAAKKAGADDLTARIAAQEAHLAETAFKAQQASMAELSKNTVKRLDVKVAGQSIIPDNPNNLINRVATAAYKPLGAAKSKAADSVVGQAINRGFNTKYFFPGNTFDLQKKAAAEAAHGNNVFRMELDNIFKGTTPADRLRITDAVENHIPLQGQLGEKGADLGSIQDFFHKSVDDMFDDRVKLIGDLDQNDYIPNFAFHYYKAGDTVKNSAFKAERKKAMSVAGKNVTLEDAAKAGRRPTRDAKDVLIAHKADHVRKLQRHGYERAITDNYSLITDNPQMAAKLGLTKAPKSMTENMNLAPGYQVYFQKDVLETTQNLTKALKLSDEGKGIVRLFDKAQGYWKVGQTAFNPGYHSRNMYGDMYLNSLDGVVDPRWYKRGAQVASNKLRGNFEITMNGIHFTGDEIEALYVAAGAKNGFINSEIGDAKHRIFKGVRAFSEGREEMGRYAHFLHALNDELTKRRINYKTGKTFDEAVLQTGRRVNKYNLDFTDLTPFQQNVMKRIMPFYTYTRKVMPLMAKTMYEHPGRMTAPNKMLRNLSNAFGVDLESDDPNGPVMPDWVNTVAHATLNNDYEPLTLQFPGLANNEFANWGNPDLGENLRENIGNRLTPAVKYPLQMMTGTDMFTGGKFNPNPADILRGEVGVVRPLENIKDLATWQEGDESRMPDFAQLTGVGLKKITENQQLSQLYNDNSASAKIISEANKSILPFEVTKTSDGYTVRNKDKKTTILTGLTQMQAYKIADKYAKQEHANSKG